MEWIYPTGALPGVAHTHRRRPAGHAAPYLIEDRYEDATVLRDMTHHRWHPGAHRIPRRRPRIGGVVGLALAVMAVPVSWGVLITGTGIPGRPRVTVVQPRVHATTVPDQLPGDTGDPSNGFMPTADPSPSPSPTPVMSPSASRPAPSPSVSATARPDKGGAPSAVPTLAIPPVFGVPSCMPPRPPHPHLRPTVVPSRKGNDHEQDP
jgi:hypothetical protein